MTDINECISVELSPVGDELTLKVKLNNPGTLSRSGKSMIHASTSGNVPIPDTDMKLGLNIYTTKST